MGQVAVAVRLTLKSDMRDEATTVVKTALETAKGESGTLLYIFHHDVANANVVWFYELYKDQAALDAHMSSDAFKTFSKAVAQYVEGAPEFSILNPIGGKGL